MWFPGGDEEEGVMENVKSIAVWLLQTRWLTIDGPVFLLLWLGAACYQFHCPCLRTPSFLAILANWTNTIRAWESPALCLLFPFCCLFLAYLKPLFSHSGAGNDLYVNFEGTCIHTIQLRASQLNIQVCLHDISSPVCLLEYESAEERHCWFGKPAYGQCKASAFDPPPPRHVLVTLFRFQPSGKHWAFPICDCHYCYCNFYCFPALFLCFYGISGRQKLNISSLASHLNSSSGKWSYFEFFVIVTVVSAHWHVSFTCFKVMSSSWKSNLSCWLKRYTGQNLLIA